jgi:hypothetical protein
MRRSPRARVALAVVALAMLAAPIQASAATEMLSVDPQHGSAGQPVTATYTFAPGGGETCPKSATVSFKWDNYDWGDAAVPLPNSPPCVAKTTAPSLAGRDQPGPHAICGTDSTTGKPICATYKIDAVVESPKPTATPKAGATPTPRPTPRPSPTPKPSVSPSASASAAPGAASAICTSQGREPTAAELEQYTQQMASGSSSTEVAIAIIGSPEYFTLAGGNRTQFLNRAFEDALGREINPEALASLPTGTDDAARRLGSTTILHSAEYRSQAVGAAFTELLGRPPTTVELATFAPQIEGGTPGGTTEDQLKAVIMGSQEYRTRPPGQQTPQPIVSSPEYRAAQVTTVFRRYLHPNCADVVHWRCDVVTRNPTTDELNHMLDVTSHGQWNEQVVSEIIGSPEYFSNIAGNDIDHFARALYRDLLGRVATDAEVANARAAYSPPDQIRRENIVIGLMGPSDEYRTVLINHWFQQFLTRPPTSAEVAQWNLYLTEGVPGHVRESVDPPAMAYLMGSAEYFARAEGTDTTWVRHVTGDLLNRPSTDAEESHFLGSTSHDANWRRMVVLEIINSPEYRTLMIRGDYQRLLSHEVCHTVQQRSGFAGFIDHFPFGLPGLIGAAVLLLGGGGVGAGLAIRSRRRHGHDSNQAAINNTR